MYLMGLGIGIILASFYVCEIMFVLSERLNIVVRYASAGFPRCLLLEVFDV